MPPDLALGQRAAPRPWRDRLVLPLITLVVVAGVVVSSWLGNGEGWDGPLTDATVVARLGAYQKPYPPELREAARAARSRPQDVEAALAVARSYIDYGRKIGDARLVGTALGFLDAWLKPDRPDPRVLVLAATALQYDHDFTGALALLDRALAAVPDYDDALLIRADIDIVQGRLAKAGAACRKLSELGRIDLAVICDATAHALTKDGDKAFQRLAAMTDIGRVMTPGLSVYAKGLLGEIAIFRGQRDKARDYLAAALAAQPGDLRTMMVYADFLLQERDPAGALTVMTNAPPTDGILLRRAIAYRDLGDDDDLGAARDALQQTFDLQNQIGLSLHAREEARFELEIVKNPQAALNKALQNWTTQREFEDAQLLFDAADAAGRPEATQPVIDWMRAEGVDAPAFRIPDKLKSVTP